MQPDGNDARECPHATIGLLSFVAIVLAIAIASLWSIDPTEDVVGSLIVVPFVIHVLHRHAIHARRARTSHA
ncbi:MAG TPA: hypothetical protein VHE35_27515 [Kofleriaceae bacterium]|nr:hypothetical protein [Kofleriaceae bacterium]